MIHHKVCRACARPFEATLMHVVYCCHACVPRGGVGCHGKARFGSRREAVKRRAEMVPRNERMRGTRAYRCECCGKWHLGHPKGVET